MGKKSKDKPKVGYLSVDLKFIPDTFTREEILRARGWTKNLDEKK